MQTGSSGTERNPDNLASHYRGLRTLVTGGMGFIGSNVARRLHSLGSEVLVVDSLEQNTGANRANLKGCEDEIEIVEADLRSSNQFPEIFKGRDAVFNLAGRVSHIDSMIDPISDLESNVHAQVALLEACRSLAPDARIVFASTRQIYGRPMHVPVNEDHPLRPVDVNGVNKMAAEAYHTLYHGVYRSRTVSLRLTNTYGPGMRIRDARQTFLGIWIRRILEGDGFEVWGGQQLRDLTYVDDVVDALLLAGACSSTAGKIFNIGGGPPVTLEKLAHSLVEAHGGGNYKIVGFPSERRSIDIGDYYADDSKFRALTGWASRTSLTEGLKKTLEYYNLRLNEYV